MPSQLLPTVGVLDEVLVLRLVVEDVVEVLHVVNYVVNYFRLFLQELLPLRLERLFVFAVFLLFFFFALLFLALAGLLDPLNVRVEFGFGPFSDYCAGVLLLGGESRL